MKELSSIEPSAHQPALFFIHDGIRVGDCAFGVVFERLGPISIIPEPIPAYFAL